MRNFKLAWVCPIVARFAVAVTVVASGAAQSSNSLVGKWRLGEGSGSSLASPNPSSEMLIELADGALKVTTRTTFFGGIIGSASYVVAKYQPDGRARVTESDGSGEQTITARWRGPNLAVRTVQRDKSGTVITTELWKVAREGNALVLNRRVMSPGTVRVQRLVFTRE